MPPLTSLDGYGLRLGALWFAHVLGLPTGMLHRVLLGQRIGSGSRFGRGSCILARTMRVGRGVRIGRGSDIVAEEMEIGDDVRIGANVTIRCKRLMLAAGSRIDDRTRVYGIGTPNSGLELGAKAWVYSDCHINTDERVSIGACSAIGGRSLVFTHSSYLPITSGYPVTVAPVTIGQCVWLPWQVFVLPGADIGDGSTVGACSLVSGRVPRNCLAVGVPAKVVKDEAAFRRRYDAAQLSALGRRVLDTCCANVVGGFHASELFWPRARSLKKEEPDVWHIVRGSETLRIRYLGGGATDPSSRHTGSFDLVVTVACDANPQPGVAWLDLSTFRCALSDSPSPLLEELLASLSDYGIRLGWLPDGSEFPQIEETPTDTGDAPRP